MAGALVSLCPVVTLRCFSSSAFYSLDFQAFTRFLLHRGWPKKDTNRISRALLGGSAFWPTWPTITQIDPNWPKWSKITWIGKIGPKIKSPNIALKILFCNIIFWGRPVCYCLVVFSLTAFFHFGFLAFKLYLGGEIWSMGLDNWQPYPLLWGVD